MQHSKNSARETRADPDGPDVEFSGGRGLGHGVGLSQWGAEAKARRGMTGELILDFYYPGSKRMAAY